MEQVKGVDRGVLIAKESPHTFLLLVCDTRETLLSHFLILLHHRLGHYEVLHAVLTGIREMLCPYHTVILHGVTHLQGRVHEDTVVAVEHLSIHAPHRRADNQVRMFAHTRPTQQVNGFLRMYWQVWGNDNGIGQHLTDTCHRPRLS